MALMGFTDLMMAFPALLLAIVLAAIFQPSLWIVALVIAMVNWVQVARVIYTETSALAEREFVVAVRSLGASSGQILWRHILPHLVPTAIVWATLGHLTTVLLEATLSFLGIGVQPPTASWGSINYENQTYFQTADPMRRWHPRMIVGDLVAEPLAIHHMFDAPERRDRVAELFRRVGLAPEHMRRHPHEFSGGQRQRICIARALALEPQLIVADECVAALDVSVKARIIALLVELQATLGLSYLFISHDLATVEQISDRVAVMYAGRILETGSRRIFRRRAPPLHPPATRRGAGAGPRATTPAADGDRPTAAATPSDRGRAGSLRGGVIHLDWVAPQYPTKIQHGDPKGTRRLGPKRISAVYRGRGSTTRW